MTMCINSVTVAFALSMLVATSTLCAGAPLTAEQIQAAIQEGRKYKTADGFFNKKLWDFGFTGYAHGAFGIALTRSVNVTFFGDWEAVVLESAGAHQQMRELKADEVQTAGLVHAYVLMLLDENWSKKLHHSELVLQIGDRTIPSLKDGRVVKNDSLIPLLGRDYPVTLAFHFDLSGVPPEDLKQVFGQCNRW